MVIIGEKKTKKSREWEGKKKWINVIFKNRALRWFTKESTNKEMDEGRGREKERENSRRNKKKKNGKNCKRLKFN